MLRKIKKKVKARNSSFAHASFLENGNEVAKMAYAKKFILSTMNLSNKSNINISMSKVMNNKGHAVAELLHARLQPRQ